MERRLFLNKLFCSAAGIILLPAANIQALAKPEARKKIILKAGICSDAHRDLVPDNEFRLQSFINSMNDRGDIDFIIQLGDFCRPYAHNLPFMDIWKKFKGPAYHVIGNHEFDGGFTLNQVVAYLGAKEAYYSFDVNGYHFVVFNGNDKNPDNPSQGYPSYIGEEQRRWLADDLAKTKLPVIAFCHQSFDADLESIDNAADIRSMFERANEKAGFRKVRLIFSGHHHTDFHNIINGIHYVSLNSMAYEWIEGSRVECGCYPKEVEEKYPSVKYNMIPYKDPLWAVMTIYANGEIDIEGRRSEFMGPSPAERGINNEKNRIVPYISDRRLKKL